MDDSGTTLYVLDDSGDQQYPTVVSVELDAARSSSPAGGVGGFYRLELAERARRLAFSGGVTSSTGSPGGEERRGEVDSSCRLLVGFDSSVQIYEVSS